MPVINTTFKTKINNSNRKKLYTAFLEVASGTAVSIASDNMVAASDEKSIETAATKRIGQVTVPRKTTTFSQVIDDESIGVKRIGRVTLLGDASSIHSTDDHRQGHNVKYLNQNVCSLLPHLTINAPDVIDEFGNVINTYEETTFGQLYSFYFNVISDGIERKNIPFFDYPGRLDPVQYIKRGKYYRAYMIITNNMQDYLHYIEPDSIIHDGAIDVFEVRRQRANTGIADIQTKGIRGSFASGPWELASGTTTELKKGTSIVGDKLDVESYEYDFFEDCQDLVFGNNNFQSGKLEYDLSTKSPGSGYKYSLDGYISTGHYLYPPFVDKIAKERAYETKISHSGNQKLQNAINNNESVRDISDIGTRFKSSANGCILRPKYDAVTQTILGTDSIAFAGRLRE